MSNETQCTCKLDYEGEPLIGGYAGCPLHDPSINKEDQEELITQLKHTGAYVEPVSPLQSQLNADAATIKQFMEENETLRSRVTMAIKKNEELYEQNERLTLQLNLAEGRNRELIRTLEKIKYLINIYPFAPPTGSILRTIEEAFK